MRYLFCIIFIFSLIVTNTSCFSYHKEGEKHHEEYIVQFKKDVNEEKIQEIFKKYDIMKFSYLRTSQKRGHIILIHLKDDTKESLSLLKQEECIQNIDPNFEIHIDK